MARSDPADEQAARQLAALFAAHHEAVARYVRRRTSPEAVDDVVAETFLVACRRLPSIPAEPLPWLLGVARRVLATQRRSARRRLALSARLATAVAPEPAGGETEGSVRDALARLSEPDREALTLIAWEGLTTAQAAVVLGISHVAFRARFSRARRRLRKQLDQRVSEPAAPARSSTRVGEAAP
jgi:RNA polymerase sigma-70 factor (ECF subfamily)